MKQAYQVIYKDDDRTRKVRIATRYYDNIEQAVKNAKQVLEDEQGFVVIAVTEIK